MGIGASSTSILLAHSLQFSFLLMVATNFLQHLLFEGFAKKGSHVARFGPLYTALLGAVLLMLHPSLFVFQDVGCPVRCFTRDHASALHATFYSGVALTALAALWSMGYMPIR